MELQQVLESRRSIRAYDGSKKIEKSQIEKLIKAASLAPSWKNSQTGRYYVVMSEEMVADVKANCLPGFNQNSSKDAPVLIVTTFVKDRAGFSMDGNPDNELGNGWGCYDLGLQNENLVLKAEEMGLGTLIMGIRDEKLLREKLNIPESEILVAVIAVGAKAIEPAMPKRKLPEEIAVFF